MKIQNLAYAGGRAGTFGVWFFPPARLRARVCKNAILSCHLAIFVSLIHFLKGVGCKMKFQNLAYADGRAGTFGVWFSRPPAYARGICKKRHFKLHPTPSFRHLSAQHPLPPLTPIGHRTEKGQQLRCCLFIVLPDYPYFVFFLFHLIAGVYFLVALNCSCILLY